MDHEDLRRAVRRAVAERVKSELPELFPEGKDADGDLPLVESLFPPDFPADALAVKHGFTIKVSRGGVFRRSPGTPAYYDPETKTITLNPDADTARVAEEIRRRAWVRVPPEHALAFAFLHEVAHHSRRKHLPSRNGVVVPLTTFEMIEVDEEETLADQIAKRLYYQWKWTR